MIGDGRLPKCRDPVSAKARIACCEHEIVGERLRNNHSIERIPVQPRECL